jgi:hypothetical protein
MADKIIQTNNNLPCIKCNPWFCCPWYTQSAWSSSDRLGMDIVIFIDIHEIWWFVLLHTDNQPSCSIISGNSGKTWVDIHGLFLIGFVLLETQPCEEKN